MVHNYRKFAFTLVSWLREFHIQSFVRIREHNGANFLLISVKTGNFQKLRSATKCSLLCSAYSAQGCKIQAFLRFEIFQKWTKFLSIGRKFPYLTHFLKTLHSLISHGIWFYVGKFDCFLIWTRQCREKTRLRYFSEK